MKKTINSGHKLYSAITLCFFEMGGKKEQKGWQSVIKSIDELLIKEQACLVNNAFSGYLKRTL